MNIVGLGGPGCQIAKNFEEYGQYKVFCIDTEDKGYSTFLSVKAQNSHEEYEKNYKKLKLTNCTGPTAVILAGSGKISGCVMRLLEQIKKNPINIIYIKPDLAEISFEERLIEKTTFGVLQQYARSALIQNLYVVSNAEVELALEDISIKNYWRDINNVISSTYHMINVFDNTEPILTTSSPKPAPARIGTFGVVNFDTNKERLFYDLEYTRMKKYFYAISEASMTNDKDILNKIRSFSREHAADKLDVGFSIYSTSYEHNYVYTVQYASYIQEQNLD